MTPKICPKCSSEMQPGFPVETGSKGGQFVTRWSDQLPREITGIFGGHAFTPRATPKEIMLGFACKQCGFVELYLVSEHQLQQFLQDNAAQQPNPAGGESPAPPRL